MRVNSVEHEFVEFAPSELRQGVVYISIEYATVFHLCACGCGNKVVTPLSPAEWQLTFDGESVSLSPSIGNWEFPCQSHYWIRRNQIRWAGPWSAEKIEAGRRRDAQDLEECFGSQANAESLSTQAVPKRRLLSRVRGYFKR